MSLRTRKLALTEGVTAGVLFGTAAIFIRLLQNLDAFSIAFWRLIIASLALAIIMLILGKSFRFDLLKRHLREFFVLGFFLGLHFVFFISAVKDTTILNATILVNTTPIFSMFVSSFFYKLKPSRLAVLGSAVSLVGVCVIAYADAIMAKPNQVGFSLGLRGDLEAVLAALVESFYLNYGREVRSQVTILSTMSSIYVLTAFVVGILGVPVSGRVLVTPTEVGLILPLVGLGVVPTAAAHTLYFSSLSNLRSFETAALALLEPVGATVLGIFFFGEIPAFWFVFGAALIVLGILFTVARES